MAQAATEMRKLPTLRKEWLAQERCASGEWSACREAMTFQPGFLPVVLPVSTRYYKEHYHWKKRTYFK